MISIDEIFKICLESETAAMQLKNSLSSPLIVASPFKRKIGDYLSTFVDKYGEVPKEGDLSAFISSLDSQKQKTGIKKALREIQSCDVSGYTSEYLADEAMETFRRAAAENAAEKLRGGEVTPEMWEEFYEEIQAIEPASLSGMADLRDVGTWLKPQEKKELISTGIENLDQRIGGGWGRGELAFIMADSGVGKSTSLINYAHNAAFEGQHVLHITLELSQRNAALRFYRRVTEKTRREIQHDLSRARQEVEHFWRYAEEGGEYRLFYREPMSQTPEDIRAMVELYTKQEGEIDVLILDYLDLMAPSPEMNRSNRYEQLGHVSHKIRGLGEEKGCAVISATQARRPSGKEYEDLRLSDMGDSYEKIRAADVVVGFVRTEQEVNDYQGRYQVLKVREGARGGGEVPLLVDLDKMMIEDLDSPDGRRVARELGVSPIPLDPEQR